VFELRSLGTRERAGPLSIGIDPGVRNIGFCCLNQETLEIEYWACLDLGPVEKKQSSAVTVKKLLDKMDTLPDWIRARASMVTLEWQAQNRYMPQTPVFIALMSWWYLKCPGIKVEAVQPVAKFKMTKPEHKVLVKECVPRTDILRYRAIKQRAVEITMKILTTESLECSLEWFKGQKKKDDLSDAFLTALVGV
jgi:hypothetical protein